LRPVLADVHRFPVFISYGDEAIAMKQRIKRLVEDALNRQLSHGDWQVELPVWDWRDIAAQRAPEGGRTNDLFVERARLSSVTIVLLLDRVPEGTKEELFAVLNDQEVDLKVFWLRRRRRFRALRGPTDVELFLDRHKNDFSYLQLSDLDSEQDWIAITSNLIAVLLKALRGHERRPYVEAR
jgi:hypothetical protein